jgi:hypothetical protein
VVTLDRVIVCLGPITCDMVLQRLEPRPPIRDAVCVVLRASPQMATLMILQVLSQLDASYRQMFTISLQLTNRSSRLVLPINLYKGFLLVITKRLQNEGDIINVSPLYRTRLPLARIAVVSIHLLPTRVTVVRKFTPFAYNELK